MLKFQKITLVTLVALIGILFTRCSTNNNEELTPKYPPGNTPEEGGGDGTVPLLKQAVFTYPEGFTQTYEYKYDAQNRVIFCNFVEPRQKSYFEYDELNRLSKLIYEDDVFGYTQTQNFDYTDNEVIISSGDYSTMYLLEDGNVKERTAGHYEEDVLTYYYDTENRLFAREANADGGIYISYTYHAYDNRKNPFENISVKEMLFKLPTIFFGFEEEMTYINNVTHLIRNDYVVVNYDYIEFENDYPKKCIVTSPTNYNGTIEFYYYNNK